MRGAWVQDQGGGSRYACRVVTERDMLAGAAGVNVVWDGKTISDGRLCVGVQVVLREGFGGPIGRRYVRSVLGCSISATARTVDLSP